MLFRSEIEETFLK